MDRNAYDSGQDQVPVADIVVPASASFEALTESAARDADDRALARARCRFPIELFVFITVTLATCFNLGTFYKFHQQVTQLAKETENLPTLAGTPNGDALAFQHAALIAGGASVPGTCDMSFLASPEGLPQLREQMASLSTAAQVIFYLALAPQFAFLWYRLAHLVALRAATHHQSGPKVRHVKWPNSQRHHTMNVGDLSMKNELKRAERLALRGETSGYIFAVFCQEVPQVMIYLCYVAFVHRFRSLNCITCSLQLGAPCSISKSDFYLTDDYWLNLAMAGTFVSVLVNYIQLGCRWFIYLQTEQPPWGPCKQSAFFLLGTAAYFFTFIFPSAILVAAYLGPTYYVWFQLAGPKALSAIGGGVWGTGAFAFLSLAGLELGDSCMDGLCCSNFCDMATFLCPCFDYIAESFVCCGCCKCCEEGCCCCC